MEQIFNFIVDEANNKVRIDKWLSLMLPQMSRVKVQNLIEKGLVLDSNDEIVVDKKLLVKTGDEYSVTIIEENVEIDMQPEDIPVDILYEDDDLVVVNKTAVWWFIEGLGKQVELWLMLFFII